MCVCVCVCVLFSMAVAPVEKEIRSLLPGSSDEEDGFMKEMNEKVFIYLFFFFSHHK